MTEKQIKKLEYHYSGDELASGATCEKCKQVFTADSLIVTFSRLKPIKPTSEYPEEFSIYDSEMFHFACIKKVRSNETK